MHTIVVAHFHRVLRVPCPDVRDKVTRTRTHLSDLQRILVAAGQ